MWRTAGALSIILAACGGDDGDDGDGGGARLKSGLDLANVTGFALSGDASSARSTGPAAADGDAHLYAIAADGTLTETTVIEGDESGSTSSTTVPTGLYDTTKHLLITYAGLRVTVGDTMTDCGGVIVRKSDGALFCYLGGMHDTLASDGADRLFADGPSIVNSNTGSPGAVTRIDMATEPSLTQIVDAGEQRMEVNHDGDALISISSEGTSALRIYKDNGGLQNLSTDNPAGLWLAPNGHDFLYVHQDQSSCGSPAMIMLATRQSDGSYVTSENGTVTCHPTDGNGYVVALVTESVAYAVVASGNPDSAASGWLVELTGANQGTEYELAALTGLSTITDARGGSSSVFVRGTDSAGNGGIARIAIPAATSTMALPPGDFTLTAFSVASSGVLSFAGLRNSDGARIIGSVAANADTYTITSATAPTVTQLVQL